MAQIIKYPVELLDFSPDEWSVYDEFLKAQEKGDRESIERLRAKLPAEQFARVGCGDMYPLNVARIVTEVAGKKSAGYMPIAVHVGCLSRSLAGPKPSAVEQVLGNLVALAWLDYQRCVFRRETLQDPTFKVASYYDQRVDRA